MKGDPKISEAEGTGSNLSFLGGGGGGGEAVSHSS